MEDAYTVVDESQISESQMGENQMAKNQPLNPVPSESNSPGSKWWMYLIAFVIIVVILLFVWPGPYGLDPHNLVITDKEAAAAAAAAEARQLAMLNAFNQGKADGSAGADPRTYDASDKELNDEYERGYLDGQVIKQQANANAAAAAARSAALNAALSQGATNASAGRNAQVMSDEELQAQYNEGYSHGVPADLRDGLVLWLDAADTNTITSSEGLVSSWKDKSGNMLDYVSVSDNKRPSVSLAVLNGKSVLHFDGTDDGLQASVGPVPAGTDKYTYAIVWRPAVNKVSVPYEQYGPNPVGRSAFLQETGGYGFVGENHDYKSFPYTAGKWMVSIMRVDDTTVPNILMRSNGTDLSGTTGGAGQLDIGNAVSHVGQNYRQGEYFNGDIAEIVVYDKKLEDNQVDALEGYLNTKYGLGSSPAN